MLVPRLPTREGTAAIRAHIAAGGRDVELELGTRMGPGVVIQESHAGRTYRVEIRGAALIAVRAATSRASIFTRDVVPAFTFTGEVDPPAGLVRGHFAMDADLGKGRWATIAQADLWHLALIVGKPA